MSVMLQRYISVLSTWQVISSWEHIQPGISEGCSLGLICVRRRLHSDDCQRLTSVEAPSRHVLVDEPRTFVQLVQCLLARYPCECEHGFVCTFHLVSQCRNTFRLTLPRLFLCSILSARVEMAWVEHDHLPSTVASPWPACYSRLLASSGYAWLSVCRIHVLVLLSAAEGYVSSVEAF